MLSTNDTYRVRVWYAYTSLLESFRLAISFAEDKMKIEMKNAIPSNISPLAQYTDGVKMKRSS